MSKWLPGLFLLPAVAFGTSAPMLENDQIRLQLDPATGGFLSILDKQKAHDYIAAPDRAALFRLIVPDGEQIARPVDAARPVIEIEDQAASLKYDLDGIKVAVRLELNGRAVLASLSLSNQSDQTIEETVFPWIRGVGPLPNAALIGPYLWWRRIDDPFGAGLGGDHRSWNQQAQKQVFRYPAHLATAWYDYGNAGQGLALEGRHTDFSILDFSVHKVIEKDRDPVRKTLDLSCVQPRRVRPGESWTSAPVRIFVHEGDWHRVADAHREWLETWVRKPDRPRPFAESIGWHFIFLKHQDGRVLHTYQDLPKIAEAALTAGCPYLLVFGWQAGGHDNNYMYRYVPNERWGGAEGLREALEQVRARGVEALPFFNGTVTNVTLPEHAEFGHRWEVKTRAGHPLYGGNWVRHNFDAPTRNRDLLHHELCPCDEHRAYFMKTVRRMLEDYGFTHIQLDQISEKMFPCYNELHRHRFPDRAFVDGLGELLPSTRSLVREINPEGVVLGEGINDFTGQYCDSFWTWSQLHFPEPILYSLPWLMMSHEIDANEFGPANMAFALKLHLDLKIDGGDSPISKYPAFAAHIKGLAELRKQAGAYYIDADFRDQEGLRYEPRPGVTVRCFHNRTAGKLGIVTAETDGNPAEVTIRHNYPAKSAPIRIFSNLSEPEQMEGVEEFKIALEPYEVRVMCVDLRQPLDTEITDGTRFP